MAIAFVSMMALGVCVLAKLAFGDPAAGITSIVASAFVLTMSAGGLARE